LGFGDRLVGISHSCDPPPGRENLPRLTSTVIDASADSAVIDAAVRERLRSSTALYELDIDTLAELAPDVIVSQGLCDVCAVATGDVLQAVAALPSAPQLVDLTPLTLDDVFADIARVGRVLGVAERGEALAAELRRRCEAVQQRVTRPRTPLSCVFLEWLDPPFNGGHWNPELIALAGGRELLGRVGKPSETICFDDVSAADPDVLVIAVCGQSAARARSDLTRLADLPVWSKLRAVSEGRVLLADGHAHFSRPGPALVDGLEWLAAGLDAVAAASQAEPGSRVSPARFAR
ncbi:MAG: ABC transporter substrate-binding protein, partial [Pseudomonadota bacterium]